MYKLELSEEMLNTIFGILTNAPVAFRVTSPIISELQRQLADQLPKSNGSGIKQDASDIHSGAAAAN